MHRNIGLAFLALSLSSASCLGLIGGDGASSDNTSASYELCDGEVPFGPTPLRRLTRTEYDNTVSALFGAPLAIADEFIDDEAVSGFADNTVGVLTKPQLDEYMRAADELATLAVETYVPATLSCDWADSACVEPFIADLAARAFRQPATADELARLLELYTAARDEWGAADAVKLTIEAILLSPKFLYHVEIGTDVGAEVSEVTGHELAARLAYFLWQSPPDAELTAAAENGALDDADAFAVQVRRVLEDDRAANAIASFHIQWLELEGLENASKNPESFPEWSAELAAAMVTETGAFAAEVVLDGDARVSTLLTGTQSVVDDPVLAGIYGIDPSSSGLVEVGPERAGILTQPSLMARTSGAELVSWVQRGFFVRTKLLCGTLPPPPAAAAEVPSGPAEPSRLNNPDCKNCHQLMDLIGMGFDQFDPIGRYLPQEDAAGEVIEADVAGEFVGVAGLAALLAESADVSDCIAEHWFRYALRRNVHAEDRCTVHDAQEALREHGGDIRELLFRLATSSAFRHKKAGKFDFTAEE